MITGILNLLKGMGSILDIYHSGNYSKYLPERDFNGSLQTDAENLRNDWIAVGNDLRRVMGIAPHSEKDKT
ncbi:MAG: hypothetical protein HQK96_18755 [Nitrospirae bacterium]|nr:hypothetical protein [Nitrospirota bacterium]